MGEEKKDDEPAVSVPVPTAPEVKKEDENKDDSKKEEEKKKESEEEEAEPEPPQEIVLKVDMHCEACARKVARSLKGFQGVEDVMADCKASKVVVKGKTADPIKVCERVQKKSRKKVELISPLPKPPSPPQPPPEEDPKQDDKNQQEQKKEEPPAVITVVLNVRMHCEACAQVLQKRIRKIKGVELVMPDIANDQVIVKGVVDPDKLVKDVYKRTGKQASVVKEEEKKEDEKKDEENKDEEKKEEKVDEKKQEGNKEDDDTKTEIKKSEYWPPPRYYMEYSYPPQMFSDENPNACSVM